MKRFRLFSLLVAALAVGIDLVVSVTRHKRPDLPSAIIILVGVPGFFAGLRMVAFVFTEKFEELTKSLQQSFWRPSAEEVFIGGLALGWASAQAVLEIFSKIAG